MQKFVVIGLPRSGSTYISTLLNSHPGIHSAGEYFNPYEVIDIDRAPEDDAVFNRDARPLKTAEAFFERAKAAGMQAAGFKFMIGHNVSVLQWIAKQEDIKIIFIRRENKLAQVSSFVKALQTLEWVQMTPKNNGAKTEADKKAPRKYRDMTNDGILTIGPRSISQRWHEMATYDFLFSEWMQHVPNKVMRIGYLELRNPDMPQRLCDFIGVPMSEGMKSPLHKQGSNKILDRFVHKEPIRKYFERRGLARWLGEEL